MQYQLTFSTIENRNVFAEKCGLATSESETIYIPLALLGVAKADANVQGIVLDGEGELTVIINTDDAAVLETVTIEEDLGEGVYVVKTSNPLALYDLVAGKMDPADAPVKLMSELSGETTDLSSQDAQWARIRITSRYRPFPTSFEKISSDYKSKPEIFVIDSGINFNHAEFQDDALEVVDFFKINAIANYADNLGHGTAIASTIAGKNVGLQQHAKLMNVKTFDLNQKPTLLDLGAAIDAILAHHQNTPTVPKVVNCSWLVPKSFYLEQKIQSLINSGITVVAAAGNFGDDVALYSPAGMANVITVAASDSDDIAAGFNNFATSSDVTTNFGQVVDIFAPGVQVTVADVAGAYVKTDGTSISAGFVSGAAAALMSVANSVQTPETVLNLLVQDSTKGVLLVDNAKFSSNQNRMIHLVDGNGEIANYGDLDFYMGIFNDTTETMDGDINNLAFGSATDIFGNSAAYSLVWDNEDIKTKYEQYVALNSETGEFNISKPLETLPEGQTLEIVKFKIRQTSTVGEAFSPNLFFFATDPSRDASYDYNTDIASALENINSQSYFAAWRGAHIK
jgi:hypothetical protein